MIEKHTKQRSTQSLFSFKSRSKRLQLMIDRQNFFDQPLIKLKIYQTTYDNIRKIATGQGDDYTTGCLLDYSYFKEHYKLIAINLMLIQKQYS